MTDNEMKLLSMIRDHTHPEQAMVIAIATICWFLTQSQSFAPPFVADAQELA